MNELPVLSDDCRYQVLLAKVKNKVGKNEEALLSLQRVSSPRYLAPFLRFRTVQVKMFRTDVPI